MIFLCSFIHSCAFSICVFLKGGFGASVGSCGSCDELVLFSRVFFFFFPRPCFARGKQRVDGKSASCLILLQEELIRVSAGLISCQRSVCARTHLRTHLRTHTWKEIIINNNRKKLHPLSIKTVCRAPTLTLTFSFLSSAVTHTSLPRITSTTAE